MNEIEIWKDIPEYEGYYQCSNLGRVKSLARKILDKNKLIIRKTDDYILKQGDSNGYPLVILQINSIKTSVQVHKLVAICFLNHIPNGHINVVDHINGDKKNNNLSNLHIVTGRANISDCFRKDRNTLASKFVGVHWHKRQKRWISRISINGISNHLGCFISEQDASDAYQIALLKL